MAPRGDLLHWEEVGGGTLLCDSRVSVKWALLIQKGRVMFVIQSISPVTLGEVEGMRASYH